jgi:homoserine kinase
MKEHVIVRAPATTANMGPGFDCMAMALDLWSTIEFRVGAEGFEVSGLGSDAVPQDGSSLVQRCFQLPFEAAGRSPPAIGIVYGNAIPVGKGLGSSSAAVIAGLMAGNEISGAGFDDRAMIAMAAEVEGHPDNAAAALLGGCQLVAEDDHRPVTAPVPLPDGLNAVAFIPDGVVSTKKARALLENTVSRRDAVYNLSRLGMLVRALATGDLAHLAIATQDQLHQPARQSVFPQMKVIFRAALDAGALGVFLSGSGSAVVALTRGREMTVGYEMADAADKSGLLGEVKITRPTLQGAHLLADGGPREPGATA